MKITTIRTITTAEPVIAKMSGSIGELDWVVVVVVSLPQLHGSVYHGGSDLSWITVG